MGEMKWGKDDMGIVLRRLKDGNTGKTVLVFKSK